MTGSSGEGTNRRRREDAELAARVKAALMAGTRSTGVDVRVDCAGGLVRLHGIVDALAEKVEAERIAQSVPGVEEVENNLAVATDGTITDDELEEELRGRLDHVAPGVYARISGGSVTLAGRVRNLAEAAAAEAAARTVPGVKEVRSEVRVQPDPGPRTDDASLTSEANRLLAVDHGDAVHVLVEDGVARLRGQVSQPGDREAVREVVASIDGIRRIEDGLEVIQPD